MAFGNNAIAVEVLVDTGKAEVTLQQFQQSFQSFTNNYNQTINNIYQLSEKSTWSFSKLATTIADTGFAFANIKAVISSIANLVNGFVQFGDALDKASARTGISVSNLSGLKFAAEQSGASFETLTNSIRSFSNIIGSAELGDIASIDKLSKIGINADLYKGLNANTQLKMLADHIASLKSPAEQARVAMELFGEAGYQLLPMLQQGSAGINDLTKQAKDMGFIVGSDSTTAAASLGDALNVLQSSFSNLKNSLIGVFAPLMTSVVNLASSFLSVVSALKPVIAALGTVLTTIAAVIVGATALSLGFNAITTAVASTKVALTALNLNPAFLAITALTAGVYFLNKAFDNNLDILESLTSKASEATKITENQIDADAKLLNRLNELSQQENLTNSEMEESKLILSQLEDGFGTWGIKLDETTGKLTGVTDGMKKFREEALKVQKQRKQAELKAVENELTSVNDEIDRSTTLKRFNANWTPIIAWFNGIKPEETTYVKDLRAKKGLLEAQKAQLELDLKATQYASGNANTEQKQGLAALTSQNQAARKNKEQEEQKKITDANKNAQSMAQTVADAKLTDYELKIKKIDEQRQKALNDLEIVRKDAVSKGDKTKIEWVDNQKQEIDAWARTQKNKVNVDFLETQQKERQQAEQKAQQEAQQRAELLAKGENTTNPEVAKAENKVNQIQERINQKVLNGEAIDLLKKELDTAKVELARTVATVSGQARIEARTQYEKELREYNQLKRSGVSNEELSAKWKQVEQAQAEWKKQDNEYTSAVGVIQASREASANNQIELARENFESVSRGTFNAWEVGSIGNTTAKEQLVTLKNMLNELIELRKNAEEGGIFA